MSAAFLETVLTKPGQDSTDNIHLFTWTQNPHSRS